MNFSITILKHQGFYCQDQVYRGSRISRVQTKVQLSLTLKILIITSITIVATIAMCYTPDIIHLLKILLIVARWLL